MAKTVAKVDPKKAALEYANHLGWNGGVEVKAENARLSPVVKWVVYVTAGALGFSLGWVLGKR